MKARIVETLHGHLLNLDISVTSEKEMMKMHISSNDVTKPALWKPNISTTAKTNGNDNFVVVLGADVCESQDETATAVGRAVHLFLKDIPATFKAQLCVNK